MKKITLLGSTGSIGRSTLDVLARHPDRWEVLALSAHQQVDLLFEQCSQWHPRYAVMADEKAGFLFEKKIKAAGLSVEVGVGKQALVEIAQLPAGDTVLAAIVGGAGLPAAMAAARAGKEILLANKEALIMAGSLFMKAVLTSGARLLPVDSEHNAIFQCLGREYRCGTRPPQVEQIVLTASGGIFRNHPLEQLNVVTPEQACQHPNWVMGKKITVDCATMVNKGLEMIEAKWLFDLKQEEIKAILHPESIIHSFVHFEDGSTLAQLGQPDMRMPISYCLGWPERIASGVQTLDLKTLSALHFAEMDLQRYPAFAVAQQVLKNQNPAASIIYNAANEIAVARFLDRQVRFTDIPAIVETVLSTMPMPLIEDLEQVFACDLEARMRAETAL